MKLPKFSFWKQLLPNQRIALLFLVFVILALPLSIIASRSEVRTRKSAASPQAQRCPITSLNCSYDWANNLTSLDWSINSPPYQGWFAVQYGNSNFVYLSNQYNSSNRASVKLETSGFPFRVGCADFYPSGGISVGGFAECSPLVTPTPIVPVNCPSSHPCRRIYYGDVKINGDPAPIGTDIKAYSPRGELVGCSSVGSGNIPQVGILPFMNVYGTEAGYFSGLNSGEKVTFKINNNVAFTNPSPINWYCDGTQLKISLELTPTPTPTIRITPTFTPTPRPTMPPTWPTPTPKPTIVPTSKPIPSPTIISNCVNNWGSCYTGGPPCCTINYNCKYDSSGKKRCIP